jgi:DNA modification methylase
MDIHNDDCFNIFPKIKDKTVDLVCVDLPYGQTSCKWDTCIDLEKMWSELKRIGKKNCVYVFFCSTKFGYKLIQSNEKWFRYDLVWEKTKKVGFLSCNIMPLRKHEMIYIFKQFKGCYNPQKTKGKPWSRIRKDEIGGGVYSSSKRISGDNPTGDRYPTSIIKCDSVHKTIHPTQKPLDLCEWLVKTYSNEGDNVLDFCMGSGTTGVACKNTDRRFIGVEKDPNIFQVASVRLKD